MATGADRPDDLRRWVRKGVRPGVRFKPDTDADIQADSGADTEPGPATAGIADLAGNCLRPLGGHSSRQEKISMHGELQED
jgi:hypothetical protein